MLRIPSSGSAEQQGWKERWRHTIPLEGFVPGKSRQHRPEKRRKKKSCFTTGRKMQNRYHQKKIEKPIAMPDRIPRARPPRRGEGTKGTPADASRGRALDEFVRKRAAGRRKGGGGHREQEITPRRKADSRGVTGENPKREDQKDLTNIREGATDISPEGERRSAAGLHPG